MWRTALPELVVRGAVLREPRVEDAPSLHALLTSRSVTRFTTPPVTLDGFEQFIAWSHAKRAAGQYYCFAVVPDGCDRAVGLIQIQVPAGRSPEWGFVLAPTYWGTGLFAACADAVLDFAFDDLGLPELGARLAATNGRGAAALRKLGAVPDPMPRATDGRPFDESYWTITPRDRARRVPRATSRLH
ncbi:MAG: GNAT family N-acetyltransferase [Acidobacteria bacterium]|nr:GNAT family N-acetyltransferase [Acidobacteriota bacterium]